MASGAGICPQCRVPVVAANSALRVSDSLEAALNLVGDLEARLAWAEGHIIELQAQEFAASSRATTSDGILHSLEGTLKSTRKENDKLSSKLSAATAELDALDQ